MSAHKSISSLTVVPQQTAELKPLLSIEEKKLLDLLVESMVRMASKQSGKLDKTKPAAQ